MRGSTFRLHASCAVVARARGLALLPKGLVLFTYWAGTVLGCAGRMRDGRHDGARSPAPMAGPRVLCSQVEGAPPPAEVWVLFASCQYVGRPSRQATGPRCAQRRRPWQGAEVTRDTAGGTAAAPRQRQRQDAMPPQPPPPLPPRAVVAPRPGHGSGCPPPPHPPAAAHGRPRRAVAAAGGGAARRGPDAGGAARRAALGGETRPSRRCGRPRRVFPPPTAVRRAPRPRAAAAPPPPAAAWVERRGGPHAADRRRIPTFCRRTHCGRRGALPPPSPPSLPAATAAVSTRRAPVRVGASARRRSRRGGRVDNHRPQNERK